jgi:hypothetical protein
MYLADLDGHLSTFGERQMAHQVRVLVHGEDRKTHGIEWHGEELDDVLLALLREFGVRLLLAQPAAALQDGVDILAVLGVAP